MNDMTDALELLEQHEFDDTPRRDDLGRDLNIVTCGCGAWSWDSNDEFCYREWWRHILPLAESVSPQLAEARELLDTWDRA